jgi:hypothetical protein
LTLFFFPGAQIENLKIIKRFPEFLTGANWSSPVHPATIESRNTLGIENNG